MVLFRESINKKDITFALVLLVITLVISFIPTGSCKVDSYREKIAKARILETDNSETQQFGIVKTGDQGLRVQILNGKFKGQEFETVNTLIGKLELDKMFMPGDTALVGLDLTDEGTKVVFVNVIDHYRIHIEIFLFALFALMLVFFAGWTGMKALLSFLFSIVLIWKLLLPGMLQGLEPMWLTFGVVCLLTGGIIFLIGGLSKKGIVAFLGSISGVGITCILSILFGKAFNVHGAVKPFSETLLYSGFGNLDLTKIFLSGIFLASSGAVMDISMDIAASQQEVINNYPEIHPKKLILSGFAVGRAVVGTMTTTLLLAYSGGYTSMLMVFMAQGTPVVNILNISYVSAEILYTLIGSFGLVMVAPFTAIIGGIFLPSHQKQKNSSLSKQVQARLSVFGEKMED
ncbi:MAG TPA: hypothetical protein DCO79_10100 [Spirochaeta sp.]|nr:hypothetical protein [Spirochaeta sp.]